MKHSLVIRQSILNREAAEQYAEAKTSMARSKSSREDLIKALKEIQEETKELLAAVERVDERKAEEE